MSSTPAGRNASISWAALPSTRSATRTRESFAPLVPGVEFVRFNDVADLEAKFDATVCGILIEPIQGEGGVGEVRIVGGVAPGALLNAARAAGNGAARKPTALSGTLVTRERPLFAQAAQVTA